jgi:hypothetical protein
MTTMGSKASEGAFIGKTNAKQVLHAIGFHKKPSTYKATAALSPVVAPGPSRKQYC